MRGKHNSDLHKNQGDTIALLEHLDTLSEQLTEKTEELALAAHRIQKLTEQYNEEKELLAAANVASSKEMEGLERDIQRLRIESSTALTIAQQKTQKAEIE